MTRQQNAVKGSTACSVGSKAQKERNPWRRGQFDIPIANDMELQTVHNMYIGRMASLYPNYTFRNRALSRNCRSLNRHKRCIYICLISCTESETYAHVGQRDGGPVFRAPRCSRQRVSAAVGHHQTKLEQSLGILYVRTP